MTTIHTDTVECTKTIYNLTWHIINIQWHESIPAHGNIRLSQSLEKIWEIDWIPIMKSTYWDAVIPTPVDWNIYIVSNVICQKNPTRWDLYIVSGKIRNEIGWVIACTSLTRNPYYNGI